VAGFFIAAWRQGTNFTGVLSRQMVRIPEINQCEGERTFESAALLWECHSSTADGWGTNMWGRELL